MQYAKETEKTQVTAGDYKVQLRVSATLAYCRGNKAALGTCADTHGI